MAGERSYFVAQGKSLDIIQDYLRLATAHREHMLAIKERIGAEGVFEVPGDNLIVGFSFVGDLPEGLRWDKRVSGMAVPDRRLKVGKALAKEMAEHPCPTSWEFTGKMIGGTKRLGPNRFGSGDIMGFAGYEVIGDRYIISVPHAKGKEPTTPHDATPLKRSEYWALKEAAEAATA